MLDRLRSAPPAAGPLAGLTEQERTTLDLIGEGLSNRQIAARMFVAEKTVKNYVSHVLAKLGMAAATQVAVLATQVRDSESTEGAGTDRGSSRRAVDETSWYAVVTGCNDVMVTLSSAARGVAHDECGGRPGTAVICRMPPQRRHRWMAG